MQVTKNIIPIINNAVQKNLAPLSNSAHDSAPSAPNPLLASLSKIAICIPTSIR